MKKPNSGSTAIAHTGAASTSAMGTVIRDTGSVRIPVIAPVPSHTINWTRGTPIMPTMGKMAVCPRNPAIMLGIKLRGMDTALRIHFIGPKIIPRGTLISSETPRAAMASGMMRSGRTTNSSIPAMGAPRSAPIPAPASASIHLAGPSSVEAVPRAAAPIFPSPSSTSALPCSMSRSWNSWKAKRLS